MKNSSNVVKKIKRRKVIRIVLTVISACLIFLLMFNLHLAVLQNDFSNQAEQQFVEITKLVAKEQEMMIRSELGNLSKLASEEFVFDAEPSKETLKAKLEKVPKNMGIVLSDGTDLISGALLSSEYFYNNTIKGEFSATHLSTNGRLDTCQVVMSVPLYIKGNVFAVLYSVMTDNEFKANLSPSFYNGDGEIYLINRNPELLEECMHKVSVLSLDNNCDDTILSIKNSVSNLISGASVIDCGDDKKYVLGYVPIEDSELYVITTANYENVGLSDRSIKKNVLFFFNMLLLGCVVLGVTVFLTSLRSREKLNNTQDELQTVVSNIPGGVVRFMYDDCLTIQFLNEGVLKLTDFNDKQLEEMFNNKFINLIHEDDRHALAAAIVDQMTYNKTVEIDCRLKCSDGGYRWVLFKGKMFTTETDGDTCLCVLTDINETKLAQQRLNISMQRYSIVMEQSDSIIFEYNTSSHSIFISDQWNKKFAPVDYLGDFIDYMVNNKIVYDGDIEKFYATFDPQESTDTIYKCELRLMDTNGRYIWCRIKSSCIFDMENNTYRIIGKISDIDAQRAEKESLKKKAEIDSLSGLYNKGTVEMMINSYLSTSGKDGAHALMVLDIDNFKAINDNLGHLAGDAIISDITSKMQNILRSSDICGRIGGDEFVVLIKNIKDEAIVRQKAAELCSIFRHELVREDICLKVSGSIGIAFYDEHGLTYNELLEKADIALYEAKNQGKDKYSIHKQ